MASNTVFSLENLRLLDFGKIGVAFSREVERVVADCMDRPTDDRTRTVTLKFNFEPKCEVQGGMVDLDIVQVECEISSGVPKRRTKIYGMNCHRNGQLSFNPDLPAEPDQDTMFHEQERAEDAQGE